MSDRTPRLFTTQFKERAVLRLEAGEQFSALAAELGVRRKLLYDWRKAYRQLGVAGAEALAASEHLTNLVELNLWNTRIGSRGGLALLRSTRLPALQWLIMGTEEGGRWDPALDEAMEKRFGYMC